MEWNGMERMEWREWNGMEWDGNGMERMEWNGMGMESNTCTYI
jgi:hypothetical protein